MSLSQTLVLRLYSSVIEDVISGVRDTFLDDGVDEQVLQELKQLWESKLLASKAVEQTNDSSDHQPPVVTTNMKANGNKLDNATNASTTTNSTTTMSQPSNAVNQTVLPALSSLDPNNKVPVQLTLPAQAGVPGSTSRIFTLQIPASALQNNQLHQVLTGPVITATMTLPHNLAATLLQQHINAALSGQLSNFSNITPTTQVKSQLDGADDSCDDDDHNEIIANVSTMECERIPLPDENSENMEACQSCSYSSTSNLDNVLERQLIKKSRGKSLPCKLRNNRPVIKFVMDGADDTSDDDMSDPGGAGASDDDADVGSGAGSDGGPGDDEDGEEGEDGGPEDEPLNSEDDVSEEDPFDMFDTDNVVVCQYDKISRSRNKWKFYLKDGIMNLSGKDFVFQKANGDAEW